MCKVQQRNLFTIKLDYFTIELDYFTIELDYFGGTVPRNMAGLYLGTWGDCT
jgi:hypothetical protein